MQAWNILYGAKYSEALFPGRPRERKILFCTETREIVDRKETLMKHAVKKAVAAAFRIIVISAFLLSSRSALMHVQAECETPTELASTIEEAQPEIETEEAVPIQEESAEEASQAQEEGGGDEPQAQEERAAGSLSVTMIGDSVMLGAAPSILGMLSDCVIDAKVSRQVVQADSVLDSLEKQGLLRQTVVIALGTNGTFSTAKGQELIDRLGSGRTIYWVTVYGRELGWQEDSNATIRKLAEDNENVHIIDWSQAASVHTEWLCADGIHLSVEGRAAYAGIILGGLSRKLDL